MTLSGCTYVIAFPAMITRYLQSRPMCGFMLYSWVLDVIRRSVVTLSVSITTPFSVYADNTLVN